MIIIKENTLKFKVNILDRIHVVDGNKKGGDYKVVGRHWDKEKGLTIELTPERGTGFQFYRLMIPHKTIKKTKTEIRAKIVGNQFQQYFCRAMEWEVYAE